MTLSNFLILLTERKDFFNGNFYISDDKNKAVLTTKRSEMYNASICCCMIFHHFDILQTEFLCYGKVSQNSASVISDLASNVNIKIKSVLIIDDTSFVVKYKDKVKGLDIFKKVVYNINDKREIEYKRFNI